MTQDELFKKIVKFKTDNHDLPVKFCVNNETCCEDSGWSLHKIIKIEISPWYQEKDRFYTDENKIKDVLTDQAESEFGIDILDHVIDKVVEERYKKLVTQAICIYTG
jgi:hypothetical protein